MSMQRRCEKGAPTRFVDDGFEGTQILNTAGQKQFSIQPSFGVWKEFSRQLTPVRIRQEHPRSTQHRFTPTYVHIRAIGLIKSDHVYDRLTAFSKHLRKSLNGRQCGGRPRNLQRRPVQRIALNVNRNEGGTQPVWTCQRRHPSFLSRLSRNTRSR